MTKRTVEYVVRYHLRNIKSWRTWQSCERIERARELAFHAKSEGYRTVIVKVTTTERIVK